MNNNLCYVCHSSKTYDNGIFTCRHVYCVQCLYRLIFVNHIQELKNCEIVRIRCKCKDKDGYLDKTLQQIQEFLRIKITEDREREKDMCLIHPEQEQNYFCRTCVLATCPICKKNQHFEHEVLEANEYAKKYRNYLDGMNLKYKSMDAFISDFDKTANLFKEEIEKDFAGTVQNIDELIKNLNILKIEYAKIIKSRLERGVLLLKILKMFYCNFYLDLQKKDTCTDIFLLKYLKDINFEFDKLTLSHNQSMFDELNFIKSKSDNLHSRKEEILDLKCFYTEINRNFINVEKLIKHKQGINSIIQLKDGRLLTGSKDFTIRFWEDINGRFQNKETIDEFTGSVLCLYQLKDGRILSSCKDNNTIRIWCKKEGKYTCEFTLSEHKDFVTSIIQLEDERLVTASKDKTLCIWEGQNTKLFQRKQTLIEHSDGVYAIAEISNARIASGSDDNTVRIWEEVDNKYKCNHILQGHAKGVRALCWLKDERKLVSGSDDQYFKIWEEKEDKWECISSILAHHYGITCIIQLFDGRLVTASKDKTIRVWVNSPKGYIKKEVLRDHAHIVFSIIQLNDGRLASVGGDNQVIIWKGGNMTE